MKKRAFLYRVEHKDSKGKLKKHLAEVHSDADENARRKIVHTLQAEGCIVQRIATTDDKNKWPGESGKRVYKH